MDQYDRTRLLVGEAGVERLRRSHVAVFGLGGVGGYAVEALARAGIGKLTLVDHDTFSLTNLNRQILATQDTIGVSKVRTAEARIRAIDPATVVVARETFFLPDTAADFDFSEYDYVIDAIDTVTGKLALVEACRNAGTPVISCMGTGNKLDASAFRVADIYETSVCPLARIMRKACRQRGIERLKVVYSPEAPVSPQAIASEAPPEGRNAVPGSLSCVPGAAGLILAGAVIRDLLA